MPLPSPSRILALALVPWLLATASCAGHADEPATAPEATEPKLERVVMLMRHGVRPPTKAPVSPEGTHDQPWPEWPVDYGELTPHGYRAVALLANWDRRHWIEQGLLPEEGCPWAADLEIAASSKSRTQDTARAMAEGLFPACNIEIAFPAHPGEDVEFHPLDSDAVRMDPQRAMAQAREMLPPGGETALVAENAPLFALLERALGCCSPGFCEVEHGPASKACGLDALPAQFEQGSGGRPKVGALLGTASTISQTFLLEYLEGFPMEQVAWGRLSRDEIGELLEFHRIKFKFEGRAPYVAAHAASPLATRMLASLRDGAKLTVLAGHDTNIADLGGLLDLHWQVPGYPADDPPPGGALGFALFQAPDGARLVRAFYRSQTMDQVRELQPLGEDNAPYFEYLPIPACDAPCRLPDFEALVESRMAPAGT